jgi:hypothetical protein
MVSSSPAISSRNFNKPGFLPIVSSRKDVKIGKELRSTADKPLLFNLDLLNLYTGNLMNMSKKNSKAAGSSIMNDGSKARQFISEILKKGGERAFKIVIDQKVYQVRELG